MAKKKVEKTDGLGTLEIKKIRNALRLCWHRSHARKLCVDRCTGFDGFVYCELCAKRAPKIKIDHLTPVGLVDEGFIKRLFCPSIFLQGLCDSCHRLKTKKERKEKKLKGFL